MKIAKMLGVSMTGLVMVSVLSAGGALGPKAIQDRVKSIKNEAQLKWLEVPWVLDLNEGIKLAKQESRPIFLWVAGDPPLGRC